VPVTCPVEGSKSRILDFNPVRDAGRISPDYQFIFGRQQSGDTL
jgi:hypothetical protein